LKAAFEPHGYLLTAVISAKKSIVDKSYDVPQLSNFLDFINVVAYDFHGEWDPFTGHTAPLYPKDSDRENDRESTVEFSIDNFIKSGANPEKLVSYSAFILTLKIYSLVWRFYAIKKFQIIRNSYLMRVYYGL
jgi:chitinase